MTRRRKAGRRGTATAGGSSRTRRPREGSVAGGCARAEDAAARDVGAGARERTHGRVGDAGCRCSLARRRENIRAVERSRAPALVVVVVAAAETRREGDRQPNRLPGSQSVARGRQGPLALFGAAHQPRPDRTGLLLLPKDNLGKKIRGR